MRTEVKYVIVDAMNEPQQSFTNKDMAIKLAMVLNDRAKTETCHVVKVTTTTTIEQVI